MGPGRKQGRAFGSFPILILIAGPTLGLAPFLEGPALEIKRAGPFIIALGMFARVYDGIDCTSCQTEMNFSGHGQTPSNMHGGAAPIRWRASCC